MPTACGRARPWWMWASICGDVKFAEAEPIVDAITPVPGGVGTVTTSVLVGHVVQAAAKKIGL